MLIKKYAMNCYETSLINQMQRNGSPRNGKPGRKVPLASWIGPAFASLTGRIVTDCIGKRNSKPYWFFHVDFGAGESL